MALWASTTWLKNKAKEYNQRPFFSRASKRSEDLANKIQASQNELDYRLTEKIYAYLADPKNKKRRLYNLLVPHYEEILALNAEYKQLQSQQLHTEETISEYNELVNCGQHFLDFRTELNKVITSLQQIQRSLKEQQEELRDDVTQVNSRRCNWRSVLQKHTDYQQENVPRIPVFQREEPCNKQDAFTVEQLTENSIILKKYKNVIDLYKKQTESLSFFRRIFVRSSVESKMLVKGMMETRDEQALVNLIVSYMNNPKNKGKRLYNILQDTYLKIGQEFISKNIDLHDKNSQNQNLIKINSEILKKRYDISCLESECKVLVLKAESLFEQTNSLNEKLIQGRNQLISALR